MTISEDPKSSEMLDKQQQNLIAELLRGLSKSTQKDIHAMLFLICEEELKDHDKEALADHFKGNVQELSQSLSNDQKQEALLCVHQVAKAEDRATLDDNTLKLLAECLVVMSQGNGQNKKLHLQQFLQGISFDFEEDEDQIHFSKDILHRLADLMIIVGMADTLEDDEVDVIYGVFLEIWNGPSKEVGPFLGEIFKELDVWVKKGESLIDHFKVATEELVKLCNNQQIEKIQEILEDFIGADDRVSAQERILYKIFKESVG